MATEAKKKTTTSESVDITKLADDQRQLYEAAETVCERLADGKDMVAADHFIFERLGWDQHKIDREVKRIESVREFQQVAGKPADLERDREQAEQLNLSTAATIEQLNAERAEIDAAIASEQRKQRDARATVDRREAAAESLRNLVPEYVKRQYNAELRSLNASTAKQELNELKTKIKRSTAVLANLATIDSEETHRAVKNFCKVQMTPEQQAKVLIRENHDTGFHLTINESAWHQHVAELKRGLPELQSAAEQLSIGIDARRQHVDAMLNHYWKN